MDLINYERLIYKIGMAVRYFIEECPDENPNNEKGGIVLFEDCSGIQKSTRVGHGVENFETCLTSASIQIHQLNMNPSCVSSFQTRNPEKGHFGGAICFKKGKIALAGLPELANEACLLNGLFHTKLMNNWLIYKVLCQSNNLRLYSRIWHGAFKKPR